MGPRTHQALRSPLVYVVVAGGLLAVWSEDLWTGAAMLAVVAMAVVHIWALDRRVAKAIAPLGVPPVVTPLTTAIGRFRFLTALVMPVAAGALIGAGALLGLESSAVRAAVAVLMIVAVPWELPSIVAAALATGAVRMAHGRTLVRRPAAVEKLGATTVVCTRRAGLLTSDRAYVTTVVAGGRAYQVTGAGRDHGEITQGGVAVGPGADPALDACLQAGLSCNDARIVEREGVSAAVGDATERALLDSAAMLGLEKVSPRVATLPYTPEQLFMATLHEPVGETPAMVYAKGAVERVLYLCDGRLGADGQVGELDRREVLDTARWLTRRGLRVLAFASAPAVTPGTELTERSLPPLTFLGLQAMHSPVLIDALEAVRGCQDAGVGVKIITGDDALMARSSAAWVGLAEGALSGAELADGRFGGPVSLDRATVFARLLPEEERRLVRALRSHNHVVAVIDGEAAGAGRGQADVGVGTSISDEGADVVLPGGTFATAAAGIAEGRAALEGVARYTGHALVPRVIAFVVVLAVLLGLDAPVEPVHLLWLNLATTMGLMITLNAELRTRQAAFRPAPGPVRSPLAPARVAEALLVAAVLGAQACALFAWATTQGAGLAEAQTAALVSTSLVVLARSSAALFFGPDGPRAGPYDRRAVAALLAMAALQPALVYLPAFNHLFATAPLDLPFWPLIIGAGAGACGVIAVLTELVRRGVRPQVTRNG
ncbi:cation transporting ATPase C-terminal domain-containing protein [Nonomuraea sp. PA05]|uniref:cation transporting ATPase C-terminal domain-containing protein n=1 Tax=Nonomuraea sp. PA05 TaxID=2604466 RepID=UPI0016520264|nr:cation transporting ATPase C-terminal domain-containing protein [Nonomuraea sp. PA05]